VHSNRARLPIGFVALAVLTACGQPALSDPREIFTSSIEAMSEVTSAHVDLAVDGTLSLAQLGGEFSLEGTTASGDFDAENGLARFTFELPAMLGLSGDVIVTGDAVFTRTSLTGEMWMRQEVAGAGDPLAAAGNVDQALADFDAFLDREGVELTKLDDASCGEDTCYQVELTAPAEALSEGTPAASLDPSMLGEPITVNFLFDKNTNYVRRVATSLEAPDIGTISLEVTISGFNEPVEVSPPPSDQVTEGGGGLPFP
jgi:hypothetical protein